MTDQKGAYETWCGRRIQTSCYWLEENRTMCDWHRKVADAPDWRRVRPPRHDERTPLPEGTEFVKRERYVAQPGEVENCARCMAWARSRRYPPTARLLAATHWRHVEPTPQRTD